MCQWTPLTPAVQVRAATWSLASESTKHVLKVDRVWRHTSCAARRQTRMPLTHRGLRTSTSHRMKPKDRLATTAQGANRVGQKHITPCACQPLELGAAYRRYAEPDIRSFLFFPKNSIYSNFNLQTRSTVTGTQRVTRPNSASDFFQATSRDQRQ